MSELPVRLRIEFAYTIHHKILSNIIFFKDRPKDFQGSRSSPCSLHSSVCWWVTAADQRQARAVHLLRGREGEGE